MLEGRQLLSASPTLYADDTQGRLFTVVPSTGAVHVIGQMPAVMTDIAFDSHGNLYGVDFTSKFATTSQLPPKAADGFWYISYTGNFPWSHFEAR